MVTKNEVLKVQSTLIVVAILLMNQLVCMNYCCILVDEFTLSWNNVFTGCPSKYIVLYELSKLS